MGTQLTPEDAFRFARGEEVVSTSGVPAKLRRPLDFLVVTDHSNYLGLLRSRSTRATRRSLADPNGKKLYDGFTCRAARPASSCSPTWPTACSSNKPLLETSALLEIDLVQVGRGGR